MYELGDPHTCLALQVLHVTALFGSMSCTKFITEGVTKSSGMHCIAGAWHVTGPWQSWIPTWEASSLGLTCPSVSPQSPLRTMGWLS